MIETYFPKITNDSEMIKAFGQFLVSILLDLQIALYRID